MVDLAPKLVFNFTSFLLKLRFFYFISLLVKDGRVALYFEELVDKLNDQGINRDTCQLLIKELVEGSTLESSYKKV
jgi:hypothetical protein